MSLLSFLSLPYANWVRKRNKKWVENPINHQEKILGELLSSAKNTRFGNDHSFKKITSYEDFKNNVPIRDYEALKPYINRVLEGEKDVLWRGRPLYFTKTSGTTSGTKYIPISKSSMPYHLKGAREALLSYISETKDTSFLEGKTIFIQGSPHLDYIKGIPTGRLSGIVAHHMPWYLKLNNLPSFKTNCIDDWEKKIDAIVDETIEQPMSLISGIPPWVQMYFERIHKKTGKTISEVFPKFSLFVFGGVNFEPYKSKFLELVDKQLPSVETYPSSEGFIAYQDSQKEEGLLLCVNHGIFFEFIEASQFFEDNRKRITLKDVELEKDYVVILNTNAGLWGYNIGDTIRFVSLKPYRIVVSGRIKHFTSAFGEHVIGKEVEKAVQQTLELFPETIINEFHVAPQVNPAEGLPYHEWFIEFKSEPKDMEGFRKTLDGFMCSQNSYYDDLIRGNVLRPLLINKVSDGGFYNYMKSIGKLGGQNKPPRLSNNRKLADGLTTFKNG